MFEYGRHLGLAFQVVDDILDFTTPSEQLGKPQVSAFLTGYGAVRALQPVPLKAAGRLGMRRWVLVKGEGRQV